MKPKCCVCHKHICKVSHARKILQQQMEHFKTLGHTIDENGTIFSKCRHHYYYKVDTASKEKATNVSKSSPVEPKSDTLTLPIVSVGKTSRICCICRSTDGPFVAMPEKATIHVFVKQGLLVPVGVRCCPSHLDGKTLKSGTEIDKSRLRKTTSNLDASDIMWLLDRLRGLVSELQKKRLDFDDPNALSDDDILNLTV